ncbi:MAG TPA: DUF5666 domain-containing protein [Dongiaceae bacterium]|nr:DUF5666 domain-containing protein [Dongiaceae bacterium]
MNKNIKNIIFRAPYTKLLNAILLASLAICGSGCSGDSGKTSSDGKNIQVATGTIIGFGSVIVNGIRFTRKGGLADDRVKLGFENNSSASEQNLRVGMIVKVTGTIDAATDTGEYESIEFQPEIRGPLDTGGVDTAAGTLTIMGRKVQIDTNTNFENIRDLTEIGSELQAERQPELEISGNLDNATGILHATRVARKADDFNALPDKVVQIKGEISNANIAGGSFNIGSVTVKLDTAALGAGTVRADIADGAVFEVKGTLNGTAITAINVEKKAAVEAMMNSLVCIKGTATGGIDDKTLTINGPNGAITVNASAASFQIGDASATSAIAAAGASVEVEGVLQPDGSIAATRVYTETERTVKLEGNALAGAFNATASTLTLNGVKMDITATTRLVANKGKALDLANIATGDHLQIVGLFDGNTGKVKASQVQVTTASTDTFIQGPVTAAAAPNLTLIGTISVDTSHVDQTLNFLDDRNVTPVKFGSRAAFFAAVKTDGLTTVRAVGSLTGTSLSATKVLLE